jgi:acyl-coenzyme A synthetase/AMP-(fatty) acid ligase
MIYTSGTTGPAKGALHGHRVLLGHLPGVEMPHEFLPQPGDRLWTPADWAWAGGLLNILLPGLHFGVPVAAKKTEKFDRRRRSGSWPRWRCATPSCRRPRCECSAPSRIRVADSI